MFLTPFSLSLTGKPNHSHIPLTCFQAVLMLCSPPWGYDGYHHLIICVDPYIAKMSVTMHRPTSLDLALLLEYTSLQDPFEKKMY